MSECEVREREGVDSVDIDLDARSTSSTSTISAVRVGFEVFHRLFFFFPVLLCCVLVLLSSCASPIVRFPGTVRPTVKIGLVAPFEGRYRYVGYDVIYAVRLALREVNASGGVGGYSVELVAYDDGGDPTMAAEQARKLSVDPEVIAALGHFRRETTDVALGIYAEEGMPVVAPGVFDPMQPCGGAFPGCSETGIFRLGPVADVVASELLSRCEREERWAVLVTEGGPLGAALEERSAEYDVSIELSVSPQDEGWLAEVIASGANAVLCDANPVVAGEVVAALREAGWRGDFLGGPDLGAPDFSAAAGEAGEGAIFVTPWPQPSDVAGTEDFVAAYRHASGGASAGSQALLAYESTWVLLEALERTIVAQGVPTRQGMASALSNTRRAGLLGLITLDTDRGWVRAPLYWYRVDVEGMPRPVRRRATETIAGRSILRLLLHSPVE